MKIKKMKMEDEDNFNKASTRNKVSYSLRSPKTLFGEQ
jgi:hypothetical protein